MNIFVTGATGFVGRHLCRELLSAGNDVTALLRSDATDLESTRHVLLPDILDLQPSHLSVVDTIIHLAGVAHDAAAKESEYDRVNVQGTRHLAACAVEAKVRRIIYLSSVKAIGERSVQPLKPDVKPEPEDEYGRSKLAAEQLLLATSDIDVCVVRIPLVYGKGVKGNFETLVRLIGTGIPLPFLAIDNRRSYVSVKNLCDFLKVLCEQKTTWPQVLHCTDGRSVSLPGLLRALYFASSRRSRVFWLPKFVVVGLVNLSLGSDKASKLFGDLELDISLSQERIGWSPRYTMAECLAGLFR